MDELDHLPLPPDELSPSQTARPVDMTPLPLEFMQPLVPPSPVAVPISQETTSEPSRGETQLPAKKVRVQAVIVTAIVGLVGILLSGSAAVYLTYRKSPPPLSQLRAKPVIRVRHPAVPPPAVQSSVKTKAHGKTHSRKAAKKKSKTKASQNENPSHPQHKPWFSNSNQKGA